MSSSQTYYRILQVKPDADLDTIKKAYRKKMRLYHPDKFVAELSQLKQTGNTKAIQKLEKKIENAKQMTQRINGAYAVLSDTADRAKYDRHLSEERQRNYNQTRRRQRVQTWEDGRRTVKTSPHRNPNRSQTAPQEGVPWVILAGLVIMVLFVSALFSSAITRNNSPQTIYVPRNPTAEGSIGMVDLQATTSTRQETRIAGSTIVFNSTATPRSSSDNEALGDRFMGWGQYQTALDVYSEALLTTPNNAGLFVKRAMAYTQLFNAGDESAQESVLADYQQALELDPNFIDAYLGRGLFYYTLDGGYTNEIRSDLEQYLSLSSSNNEEIQAILDDLP